MTKKIEVPEGVVEQSVKDEHQRTLDTANAVTDMARGMGRLGLQRLAEECYQQEWANQEAHEQEMRYREEQNRLYEERGY